MRGLGRRWTHDTAERRVRLRAQAKDDQPIPEGTGLRRSGDGHYLRLLPRVQVPGRVERAHQVQGKRRWVIIYMDKTAETAGLLAAESTITLSRTFR